MKSLSILLAIAVVVAIFPPEVMALPATIGRDGIIVTIKGRVYQMQGKPNEYLRWAGRAIPTFPGTQDVNLSDMMGFATVSDRDAEKYVVFGGYLSVDDEGRVIRVEKPTDRSRWSVNKTGGWRTPGDDTIKEYEFSNVGAPAGKQYVGLGKQPLILKDSDGKEHEFYPVILTDQKNAVRFLLNDYSGK